MRRSRVSMSRPRRSGQTGASEEEEDHDGACIDEEGSEALKSGDQGKPIQLNLHQSRREGSGARWQRPLMFSLTGSRSASSSPRAPSGSSRGALGRRHKVNLDTWD
ncbi:hypothetical protein NHX12_005758 [Muraenolepis orangiensis]|uniref:Uncharacterized protein n=1 Tax=Muraenolepis orangiensis TaxID=630683 RepID=A0A9Q0DS46_9TELE|nr:hypothetical protein NHX12_005758 [Muraenolepis orangiensis]